MPGPSLCVRVGIKLKVQALLASIAQITNCFPPCVTTASEQNGHPKQHVPVLPVLTHAHSRLNGHLNDPIGN